jgi:hypothetical protein
MDLRATPVRTFISRLVLTLLSLFIPEVSWLQQSYELFTYININLFCVLKMNTMKWCQILYLYVNILLRRLKCHF